MPPNDLGAWRSGKAYLWGQEFSCRTAPTLIAYTPVGPQKPFCSTACQTMLSRLAKTLLLVRPTLLLY